MMCSACEEGRHYACGQQTWCECECDDLGDFYDPNEAEVCCSSYPECGCNGPERCGVDPEKCEHDYECITDWEGDPNVINGTRTWRYKLCRRCGHQAPWDGRQPEPDPDAARDRAIEDRELFGDGGANDLF